MSVQAFRNVFLGYAALALAAACAAGTNEQTPGTGASGPGPATSSTGGGGGTGGGTGGAGGQGGEADLCGGGCDNVQPPACHKVVCNDGMYPGSIGECVVVPDDDGIACDDDLFCTTNDTCQAGECVGGPPNDCGMTPPNCEEVSCDEDSDACTTVPLPNSTPCTHDNLCLLNTTCTNGVCGGGTLNDCFFAPVPDDCHVSVCNPLNGMCEPVPGNEGLACNDPNDLCTVDKTCAAGLCSGGSPKDCSSMTQGCILGVCDTATGQCIGQGIPDGQPCDDFDACTTGETCTTSMCGMGMPVTTCSQVGDGCCPSNCTALDDVDCAFSCELYAISSSRIIYHVDKATGVLTQGATADALAGTTGGLAQDPISKTVYLTSTGNDSLYTVNLLTGAVTLIGAYGDTAIVMHGLEWDSSTGTLYGMSSHNGGLYTINTTTGIATLVGTTGIGGFGNLGYDSLNNVMYMTSGGTDSTYVINRTTAAVTLLGALGGLTNPHGLAYDPSTDQLFLVDPGTDAFVTINRTTGAAIPIASFGSPNLLGLVCYDD
jgi:hypothetical protein